MKLFPIAGLVALLLFPVAAADGSISDVIAAPYDTAVGVLVGADVVLVNVVGGLGGGTYPGQPTVEIVIQQMEPDGTVGGTFLSVARSADGPWDATWPVVVTTINDAYGLLGHDVCTFLPPGVPPDALPRQGVPCMP